MQKALLILPWVIAQSFAGTITMKGISNIGKKPDFLELSISLDSRCFASAEVSNQALKDRVEQFREVVNEHIDLEGGDQLIITAGLSSRRKEVRHEYDERTSKRKEVVICEKGWRGSRKMMIRFSDLSAFERLNPAFLEIIDQEEGQTESGQGFVSSTVGAPSPRLRPETRASMEKQALREALIDASDKFKVVKELCHLANVSLKTLQEASPVVRSYQDGGVVPPSSSLSFELQYVHLAWNVVWSFDNTGGECSTGDDAKD